METTPPPSTPFPQRRAHPRLKYAIPVVIDFAGRSLVGTTEDIGVGGLGARCDVPPPEQAELAVLFNLPSGACVQADAIVRYVLPNRFGVQFTDLPQGARDALDEYTRKVLGYVRRGSRVAKRLHVTLRSIMPDAREELAETMVLNHFGGRLVCRAPFKIGERARLYWPQKNREAEVRIVSRQICGTGDLAELGFAFIEPQNFWASDLQD